MWGYILNYNYIWIFWSSKVLRKDGYFWGCPLKCLLNINIVSWFVSLVILEVTDKYNCQVLLLNSNVSSNNNIDDFVLLIAVAVIINSVSNLKFTGYLVRKVKILAIQSYDFICTNIWSNFKVSFYYGKLWSYCRSYESDF